MEGSVEFAYKFEHCTFEHNSKVGKLNDKLKINSLKFVLLEMLKFYVFPKHAVYSDRITYSFHPPSTFSTVCTKQSCNSIHQIKSDIILSIRYFLNVSA